MKEQLLDIILGAGVSVVFLACLGLYLYCIVDIHQHKVKYQSRQMLLLNLVWSMPVIGCIIYLLNRKNIWQEPNSSV